MFSIGDKISHPMHGAGVITDIVECPIGNDMQPFYLATKKRRLLKTTLFFIFVDYFAQFAFKIARLSIISLGILSPKFSA